MRKHNFYLNTKQKFTNLENNPNKVPLLKKVVLEEELHNDITFDEIRKIITYTADNSEYAHKLEKKRLPYTTTTHMRKGLFAKQKGVHSILMLDIDNSITRQKVEHLFKPYNFISYYSYSHGIKPNDRFRIMIELDRTYTSEEFLLMKPLLKKTYPYVDSISFESNRVIYLPTIYDGKRKPVIRNNYGETLSLEPILTDSIEQAIAKSVNVRRKLFNPKRISENKEFNIRKQAKRLDNVHNIMSNKSVGETHNLLYKQAVSLSYAGFSNEVIINELSQYESSEHSGKVAKDVENINVVVDSWFYKTPNFAERFNSLNLNENDIKPDEVLINEYISEQGGYILEQMKKHKNVLLHANTNTGKTHFFLNITDRPVILFVPLVNIVNQVYDDILETRDDVCIIKEGYKPDFTKKLMICTYESIHKFENNKGREWLQDALLVLDEAHNMTIASDYHFRQKTLSTINDYKDLAKNVVYMSGSPIFDSNISGFKIITIKPKKQRAKHLKLIIYKNKIQSVIDVIKQNKGQHFIYNDNKKQNETYYKLLTEVGFNCKLISSNTKQDDFVQSGILDENIDIVIATKVLSEGVRFYNDIGSLHVLKESSSEIIYQYSERPKYNAMTNVYLYKANTNQSKDRIYYDKETYKSELLKEANASLIYTSENSVQALKKDENSIVPHQDDAAQRKFNNAIESIINAMIPNDDVNLIRFNYFINKYETNQLGINYLLHKKETTYKWNNIEFLVQDLCNKYGFIFNTDNDITYATKIKNDYISSLMDKLTKETKQKELDTFEVIIDNIANHIKLNPNLSSLTFDDNNDDYSVFANVIARRFNDVNRIYKNPIKTLNLIYSHGVGTTRSFNRLLDIEILKNYKDNSELVADVYATFKIGGFYTSDEQIVMVKKIFLKHKLLSKWKIDNLTKNATTIFLKHFFHIKSKDKRFGDKIKRVNVIISENATHNYIKELKEYDVTYLKSISTITNNKYANNTKLLCSTLHTIDEARDLMKNQPQAIN